jgi:hypothetical protein
MQFGHLQYVHWREHVRAIEHDDKRDVNEGVAEVATVMLVYSH